MSKRRDLERVAELAASLGYLAKAVQRGDELEIKNILGVLMHVAVSWYDTTKPKGENHEKHG